MIDTTDIVTYIVTGYNPANNALEPTPGARDAAQREAASRSTGFIVLLNLLPLVGRLGVAAICLFWGRPLAARLFADDVRHLAGISRLDLLVVGLALLGVSLAVGAVPGILQFVGKAIWYAEGSRQAQFLPSMSQSWQALASDVLGFLAGTALAAKAGSLAAVIGRQWNATPTTSEDPG